MENAAEDDKHWLNEQNSQKKRTRGLNNEKNYLRALEGVYPK